MSSQNDETIGKIDTFWQLTINGFSILFIFFSNEHSLKEQKNGDTHLFYSKCICPRVRIKIYANNNQKWYFLVTTSANDVKIVYLPRCKEGKKTLLYNRNTIFKRVKSCNGHVFRATNNAQSGPILFIDGQNSVFIRINMRAKPIMLWLLLSLYINARMRISAAHTINPYTKAARTWNEREPKIQNLATVAEAAAAAALLANLWPLIFFFIFSPNFISRILKIYPSLINADTHIYMRIHKGDLRNAWGM